MIAGYYTALERTLFCGQPSPEHLRLWEVNVKVHRRGLELIKPGAVCKDIAAELNEIFDAEGLLPNRTFGYGHSFGVLSPLLRPGGRAGAARGHRHRPRARHGRLDGADDHGPRGPARRRRLPRARHPRRRRGRRARTSPSSRSAPSTTSSGSDPTSVRRGLGRRAGLRTRRGRVTSCGMAALADHGCTAVTDAQEGHHSPGPRPPRKEHRGHRRQRGPGRARASASVLLNGLQVLEAFTIDEPLLGVTEIAGRVDHAQVAACRASSPPWSGPATSSGTTSSGRFRLGLGLIALAGPLLADLDVRRAAHPALQQTDQRTGETSGPDGLERQRDGRRGTGASPHQVKHTAAIGTRYDTYDSASVQVFLAALPPGEVLRLFDRRRPAGAHDPDTVDELQHELDRAPSRGTPSTTAAPPPKRSGWPPRSVTTVGKPLPQCCSRLRGSGSPAMLDVLARSVGRHGRRGLRPAPGRDGSLACAPARRRAGSARRGRTAPRSGRGCAPRW